MDLGDHSCDHRFHHQINWTTVLMVLAVLFIVWQLGDSILDVTTDDDDDEEYSLGVE